MGIYRDFAKGRWVRPSILELGGKNPAIVSRHADLEDAAVGIVRSAFGLQGQKCSACSRVYIEDPVYDQLVPRLVELTEKLNHWRSHRSQRLSRTGRQPQLLSRLPAV
jgi:1-pyrroline-5-carboxylate dehydrogenase